MLVLEYIARLVFMKESEEEEDEDDCQFKEEDKFPSPPQHTLYNKGTYSSLLLHLFNQATRQ